MVVDRGAGGGDYGGVASTFVRGAGVTPRWLLDRYLYKFRI